MIVIDPGHLSGVDFNISSVTAISRVQKDGARLVYADMGRPDHGLCLVTGGSIVYTDGEGGSVAASEGDVVYLPRGKRYVAIFEGESGGDVTDVLVNFVLTDEAGRALALSDDIFRLAEGVDNGVRDLFLRIAACCRGTGSIMEIKTLVFDLMNSLFTVGAEDSALTIEACVSYINTHYADIDGIAALAELCGLGETAFRRRFREHVGMSPVHYINAVKVERACRMLRSSEMTVGEVCEQLKFYDVAYFHKVFKRYTGKTPGEVSREYQAVSRR